MLIEILKDCPKGTKLYSPIYGEVTLFEIIKDKIKVLNPKGFINTFTEKGKIHENGECMLFPSKENKTWENVCYLKDGEIMMTKSENQFFIAKKGFHYNNLINCYCGISINGQIFSERDWYAHKKADSEDIKTFYNLLDKYNYELKDNYIVETKPFKKGDIIVNEIGVIAVFDSFNERNAIIYQAIRFSNGNIKVKTNTGIGYTAKLATKKEKDLFLNSLNKAGYELKGDTVVKINKFDISTLKPFDQVLVRDFDDDIWLASLFSHIEKGNKRTIESMYWIHCIPYNDDTKHLLGTSDEAPEFYK